MLWRQQQCMVLYCNSQKGNILFHIQIVFTLILIVLSKFVYGTSPAKPNQMVSVTQCSMSEYTCTNGKCIALNKYCNNINDCGDESDEPRFCTLCNQTYYANLGITYDLELHRPREDRIPYICTLTFTAAGGLHGDVVQVTLESFTLGRFTSYTHDGCPDGYLQISEAAKTPVGGMWCGTSWGPVVFYSETRSLILTIKLNNPQLEAHNFPQHQMRWEAILANVGKYSPIDMIRFGSKHARHATIIKIHKAARDMKDKISYRLARDQNGYNFDIRLRYKVLARESAVVRYGGIRHGAITAWNNVSQSTQLDNVDNFFNISGFANRFNQNIDMFGKKQISDKNFDDDHQNYVEPKYYLGDLIPGTYCSRIFSDCDRKICHVQSPNFPGIYPRNLTCYYAVRQHNVPHGKHALIVIKQTKGNLVWVATQGPGVKKNSTSSGHSDKKFETKIQTWNECDYVQDYVTIYDGYTTRDPVILKFCGGGQSVPPSISSGPELLVEFTTSPYGTFAGSPFQVNTLHGFQLKVEVRFVDIKSPTYAKNKKNCEFWIRGTGYGMLENPKHSLPPNTTCLYHLQGTSSMLGTVDQQVYRSSRQQSLLQARFKVWISILKFSLALRSEVQDESITTLIPQEDCSGMLRIWDGPLREPPVCKDLNCERDFSTRPLLVKYGQNYTNVIARFCYGTIPKSCDHAYINNTLTRPCISSESFVSTSDYITLELKNTESTVLRPFEFKLRYEFVDLYQDGVPMTSVQDECRRKFVSGSTDKQEPATFRSNRNVFLFGRGGAKNLHCVYRFEAQRGERVHIKIKRIITKNRMCVSKIDKDINRSYCFGNSNVRLEIFEQPYLDSILLPRGCICNSSNQSQLPVEYISTSRDVEIHLTALNMTTFDDPDSIKFEGTYEFIKGPVTCKDSRRKFGPSGAIDMAFGDMECRTRPWIIEPSNDHGFLYARVKGMFLRKYNPLRHQDTNTSLITADASECPTKSRVILTNGESISIVACPLEQSYSHYEYVEIFSAGWKSKTDPLKDHPSKVVSVEFLNPENGDYMFTWMEMTPKEPLGLIDCAYRCVELESCVNASVWCDGVVHCPSGDDESFLQCSTIFKHPTEVLATFCVIILLLCGGIFVFVYKKIKRECRRSSVLQTRLKSLSSMDTAIFDEKDVIC